jgi:hypothetical protein
MKPQPPRRKRYFRTGSAAAGRGMPIFWLQKFEIFFGVPCRNRASSAIKDAENYIFMQLNLVQPMKEESATQHATERSCK